MQPSETQILCYQKYWKQALSPQFLLISVLQFNRIRIKHSILPKKSLLDVRIKQGICMVMYSQHRLENCKSCLDKICSKKSAERTENCLGSSTFFCQGKGKTVCYKAWIQNCRSALERKVSIRFPASLNGMKKQIP